MLVPSYGKIATGCLTRHALNPFLRAHTARSGLYVLGKGSIASHAGTRAARLTSSRGTRAATQRAAQSLSGTADVMRLRNRSVIDGNVTRPVPRHRIHTEFSNEKDQGRQVTLVPGRQFRSGGGTVVNRSRSRRMATSSCRHITLLMSVRIGPILPWPSSSIISSRIADSQHSRQVPQQYQTAVLNIETQVKHDLRDFAAS